MSVGGFYIVSGGCDRLLLTSCRAHTLYRQGDSDVSCSWDLHEPLLRTNLIYCKGISGYRDSGGPCRTYSSMRYMGDLLLEVLTYSVCEASSKKARRTRLATAVCNS